MRKRWWWYGIGTETGRKEVVQGDFSLAKGTAQTSLATFARVAKAAHRLEACLQRSTSDAGPACRTEAEFKQQIVAQGILSAVLPPITDVAPYRQRTRIQVHGTSLSETIIEDRK
jgi:hypothetical protein